MGQLCPLGTGYFDLLIDKAKLLNARAMADPYEVEKIEEEEERLTSMQNSPYSQTPLYSTDPYGGATPKTPIEQRTPYVDPNRSFSPTYHGGFTSSMYQVGSPTYALAENLQSPVYRKGRERYMPNSPSQSAPGNEACSPNSKSMFSPNYSPEYSSKLSPAPVYSPKSRGGVFSPANCFEGSMISHLSRNHLSPLYSPSHQSPSYSPTCIQSINPLARVCSSHYGPNSPLYNPASPLYNPSSPNYNPASPVYAPSSSAIEEDYPEEESKTNQNFQI